MELQSPIQQLPGRSLYGYLWGNLPKWKELEKLIFESPPDQAICSPHTDTQGGEVKESQAINVQFEIVKGKKNLFYNVPSTIWKSA